DDGLLHEYEVDSGEEVLAYGAPQGRPSPNGDGLVLVPSTEGTTALLIDPRLRAEIATADTVALASKTVSNGDCGASFPGDGIAAAGEVLAVTNLCRDESVPEVNRL